MNFSTLSDQNVATVANDNTDFDTQEQKTDNNSQSKDENKPFRVYYTKEEHQGFVNEIIGKRLKDYREISAKVQKYTNIIELLQNKLGLSDEEQLNNFIENEFTPPFSLERTKANLALEIEALSKDDNQLSEINIDELFNNEEFISLIRGGIPLNRAIDIINFEKNSVKREQELERQIRQNTIQSIRTKGLRPLESATVSSKSINATRNIESLSFEEMVDINRRALKGEKIKF